MSIGTTFVRHQRGKPFSSRVFMGTGQPCAVCGSVMTPKDPTVLVPLGPGDNVEERGRAACGQFYNAVAVQAHRECVEGAL